MVTRDIENPASVKAKASTHSIVQTRVESLEEKTSSNGLPRKRTRSDEMNAKDLKLTDEKGALGSEIDLPLLPADNSYL